MLAPIGGGFAVRIKTVKIFNFKGFEGEFTLGLKHDMTILVGDNEMGTSTNLEALHLRER